MPVSGVLEQLLAYWHTLPKEGNALMPARHAMRPSEIHDYLPRLSLMKRLDRYDVMVSMMGTGTDALWHTPVTGMNAFDFAAPDMRENTARLFEAILDQPAAVFMAEKVRRADGKNTDVASLFLPLADENGSPTYIVGCSVYEKRPKDAALNERVMLDHQKISNIEFIDIGGGIPQVTFEPPKPKPAPRIEQRWWEKLMPAKPRPVASKSGWLDA